MLAGLYLFTLLRKAQGKEPEFIQTIHRAFALLLELGQRFALAASLPLYRPGTAAPSTEVFGALTVLLISPSKSRVNTTKTFAANILFFIWKYFGCIRGSLVCYS